MAEIGLIASVVQLASTGLKLSISLYTFAETVASADKNITHIAKDISLTSAVLTELGENLKRDKRSGIASDNAIRTADEVVHECSEVFTEITAALEKTNGKGTGRLSVGKFKWPFLQPKMELLRTNLERLKSTLILMVQVLAYATSRKQDTINASQLQLERDQIQALIRANKRAVAGFEQLRLISNASSQNTTGYVPFSPSSNRGPPLTDSLNNDSFADENPTQATSTEGYVQLMSSMDVTALLQWIQRYGGIVDDVKSARTMLTASNMLRLSPVESGRNDRSRHQGSEHLNRKQLYIKDANGDLVPADNNGAGVHPSKSTLEPRVAPVVVINNRWDDPSPERRARRRSYNHKHYSSDDDWDVRAHSRERHRARSPRSGHRRQSSSIVGVGPEMDGRVQRLTELERRLEENDVNVRRRFEQQRIDDEILRIQEAKGPEALQHHEETKKTTRTTDLHRPTTYIKVHRKYLSADTLDLYELPWEWDERDSNYIIIKRWIPQHDQDILFEHTRKLREGRLHKDTIVELKKDQNKLLLVRKKSSERRNSWGEPSDEVDKLLGEWTTLDLDSGRTRRDYLFT